MGKSAPTPPPAPNPVQVSAAQEQSNAQTAELQSQLNNMNYYGPQGSVYYDQTPGESQWNETVSLSPSQQAIYSSQTAAEQGALGLANQEVPRISAALNQTVAPGGLNSWVSTPGLQSSFDPGGPIQTGVGPSNYGADLANEVGAQYGFESALLNPQINQQTEQEVAQLTAQGLNPNDAAWQNAMTLLGNNQAVQRAAAASNAIGLGNQEQQALFGEQLGAGNFANTAQQQHFGENQAQQQAFNAAQQQQYQNALSSSQFQNQAEQQGFQQQAYAQSLPINEFASLESGGQVSMPTGASYTPTQVAPTNVVDAYALNSNIAEQNYAQQMQRYSGGLGGLFNLGSAALQAAFL